MNQNNPEPVKADVPTASLTRLFAVFFKIGLFTFGGGWAMIAIIEREVVDKYHWVDKDEFLDLLAVAQSIPGILAVNIAVAIGDKLRKARGGYAAAMGTILPSFLIILAIAIFLTPEAINGNPLLVKIFKGIRPAVVALIVAPVISAAKSARLNYKTAFIPVVVALCIWSKIAIISNPVLWIAAAAAGGIIILKRSTEKAGKEGRDK